MFLRRVIAIFGSYSIFNLLNFFLYILELRTRIYFYCLIFIWLALLYLLALRQLFLVTTFGKQPERTTTCVWKEKSKLGGGGCR